MNKFIVINISNGIVASTHSTFALADKAARKLKGMGHVVQTARAVKKGDLWIDLNQSNDTETFEVEQEMATECDAVIVEQVTVSYIAKPKDSRCAWWSMIIPHGQQLDGNRINAQYLRAGADLELKAGDMLIDSEANHHRKVRGFTVGLWVCDGEKMIFIKPSAEIKRYIRLNKGQDLMHETGDVAACVRMSVWLRRQTDLSNAVQQLLNA